MTSWENVSFWDNYWRTQGSSSLDFTGDTVANTYTLQLDESVLADGGYSYEHSDVHLWYHGTIDTSPTAGDGSYSVPPAWYGGVHPARVATGFFYSASVGGDRPGTGVSAALGGAAVRSAVDWSAADWPSILELTVDAADLPFAAGQPIPVSYYYQDYSRPATITFALDVDKNPYNQNVVETGQESVGQTGSAPVPGGSSLSTAGVAAGTYYVIARITDAGGHARYAYAPEPVVIVYVPPSVASVIINDGMVDPPDLPGKGRQPTNWAQQRSDLRTIGVTFSEPVAGVAATDLLLVNQGVNAPADPDVVVPLTDAQLTLSEGNTKLSISFSPYQLADGVYRLEVLPTVADTAGNPMDGNGDGTGGDPYIFQGDATNRFHKLAGDFNASGGVNVQDFSTLAYWFGQPVPAAPSYVDANNSGGINVQDFAAYAANFQKAVAYPLSGTGNLSLSQSTQRIGGNVARSGARGQQLRDSLDVPAFETKAAVTAKKKAPTPPMVAATDYLIRQGMW